MRCCGSARRNSIPILAISGCTAPCIAFINPAATQEQAADLLGLPFSTYRAHLRAGTKRVADQLWQRELYGTEGLATARGASAT